MRNQLSRRYRIEAGRVLAAPTCRYRPDTDEPFERVLTDRLDLRRPDPSGDLDELFVIFSDFAGWWYDPAGRHTDPTRTRDWLARAAARFETDGLSYWTVRRRDDGIIIGVGGSQRQRTRAWNLNYRVATAQQRQGFATELARAAYSAASSLDPNVPFIAWVAAHNAPSRIVAERLGLTNYGLGVDPSDGQHRLAYADRPGPELGLATASTNDEASRSSPGSAAARSASSSGSNRTADPAPGREPQVRGA